MTFLIVTLLLFIVVMVNSDNTEEITESPGSVEQVVPRTIAHTPQENNTAFRVKLQSLWSEAAVDGTQPLHFYWDGTKTGVLPFAAHTASHVERTLPLDTPLVLAGTVTHTEVVDPTTLSTYWDISSTPYDTDETSPLEIDNRLALVTEVTSTTRDLKPGKYAFILYVRGDDGFNFALLTVVLRETHTDESVRDPVIERIPCIAGFTCDKADL